jgi:hypothetical protein
MIMFPIDQINIIKLMIHTSLAIKPGEDVLILAATDEDVEIGSLMAAEIKSIGSLTRKLSQQMLERFRRVRGIGID